MPNPAPAKKKKAKRESPERIVLEAMIGKTVSVIASTGVKYEGVLAWVDMFSIGLQMHADDPLPAIFFKGNLVRIYVHA